MKNAECNATIIAREDLNDTNWVIRVRPDSGVAPAFEAGQFTMLGMPVEAPTLPSAAGVAPRESAPRMRILRRAYSIASSPSVRDHMEFFLVLVTEGKLTPRLWPLPVGGRLWMDDKAKGEFTLAGIPPGQGLVMVSTGTGIVPFMSMLRAHRDAPPWRRIVMINGVRLASDLGYVRELGEFCESDPRVTYVPMTTREPEGSTWSGMRGRVPAALEDAAFERISGEKLDPAKWHVLLCGNPAMIDDVQKMLEPRGFKQHTRAAPGNLHFERYW